MSYDLPPSTDSTGPIGDEAYTIQEGDCVESLAFLSGHIWQTIWKHPANKTLSSSRVSQNILLPGDQLFIPAIVEKDIPCATEAKHVFVRKGARCKFRLRMLEVGLPRRNENYRLVIDDAEVITGTTDGDGWIEAKISPSARKGRLTLGDNPLQPPYILNLGGLDPITEIQGIQTRLRNLGFHCQKTGEMDEATRAALVMFQKSEELEESGEADRGTLESLKRRYGS